MAKKVLSVVLSVIMMFGCLAVIGSAADTDYKKEIDTKFFKAYATDGTFISANVTENIRFWDSEIQTEYYAAKTNADYQTLYNKMCTPYDALSPDPTGEDPSPIDFTDWWYKYRDERNGHLDIKNVASSSTVYPGDTFTVSAYVTTDFWLSNLGTGVYFEKANVTLVSAKINNYDATTNPTGNKGWDEAVNLHWGIYDNGTDTRMTALWPESLRTTEALAKYGAVRVMSTYDPSALPAGYATPRKFNNFLFATYTFKVNDNAKVGDVVNFFLTDDSYLKSPKATGLSESYRNFQLYYPATTIDIIRGVSETNPEQIDDMCVFGETVTYTNAQVTIANKATAADYTALDAAIADKATLTEANYTPTSWATYAAAVTAGSAVSRTLTSDDQATINTAAKAITDAKAALVSKEVISAEVVGSPVLNANATVNVTVAGSPDKLNLVDADNVSTVFTRDDATITTSGNNEIWAIKVFASSPSKNYTVFASYGGTYFEGSSKTFTLTATQGLDLSIHSASVADMEDGYITAGRHTITVTTSTDVYKVQILDPNYNSTCTYSIDYTPYVDNGNVRTWTISYNFTPLGSMSNIFRTRAATTTFADTGSKLAATVVY